MPHACTLLKQLLLGDIAPAILELEGQPKLCKFLFSSTLREEKALCQGWPTDTTMDLSERQFASALGNAWPLPVAERILCQMNKSMRWKANVADPYV